MKKKNKRIKKNKSEMKENHVKKKITRRKGKGRNMWNVRQDEERNIE